MVIAIGLGAPKLMEPIVRDVRSLEPTRIFLLATAESKANALNILSELNVMAGAAEIVDLEDAHDLRSIFWTAKRTIRSCLDGGVPSDNIHINYSSGTKVMTTGLTLAALSLGCRSLRYIKHSDDGVEEVSCFTSPSGVFADHDLIQARRLFKALKFSAALSELSVVERDDLDPAGQTTADGLERLATGYLRWENFEYAQALAAFESTNGDLPSHLALLAPDAEQLRALRAIAADREAGRIGANSLADVFANALRRFREQLHHDAALRAYRVVEMLAQQALREEFDIDTNHFDTRKAPAKYRPGFEALRSWDSGKVKLGIRKAYELLLRLEHPLGVAYHEHPRTSEMASLRRDTILSHGLNALTQDGCRQYLSWALELCVGHDPEFESRCGLMRFRWLSRLEIRA